MSFLAPFLALLLVSCAEAGGQYIRPSANLQWLDVPKTTSLAFGVKLDGVTVAQMEGETITFSLPSMGAYQLVPSGNGYELMQGIKGWVSFRSYNADYAMQLEFGDKKVIVRKNPNDPKRWQIYKP